MAKAQRIITKKLIPARLPEGTSVEEHKAYDLKCAKEAEARADAVAAENLIPLEATVTLKFRLCKHGRHWQAYAYDENKRRWYGLLPAPSLLSSALGILESEQYRQAVAA